MSDRTYLVSGAGSGIGKAIATAIARDSSENRVLLLGRNPGKLEATRSELPNADRHSTIAADLRDAKSIARGLADARPENLVAVIANAGLGGENHYGPEDRWDEIIATNLTGNYHLVQQALPYLRASTEAYRHVVVVSSVLARLGVPKYSAYCASKAGLLGLTRSWAAELASDKILVNAICPGWVDTDMARDGLQGIAKALGQTYEETRAMEMGRVPLGKMSKPTEIGALVRFLVSGEQISITGQALDINGGAVMA